MESSNCPLCGSSSVKNFYYQDLFNRNFNRCSKCFLIFVDREQLIDRTIEKTRYESHQNDVLTEGYERFLRRLITPIKSKLPENASGIDFGQGPYPMLIELFKKDGYENVVGYDPFFHNDPSVLVDKKYDFVTSCEVVEHMNDVRAGLESLCSLLEKDSMLVISTGLFDESIKFQDWYYIRDDTHINIFHFKTIEWIAQHFQLEINQVSKNLVIYSKK